VTDETIYSKAVVKLYSNVTPWVMDHNNVNAVTIFSDSLSAIKAIESDRTASPGLDS